MNPSTTNPIHFRDADLVLRERIVAKLNVPGRHRLGQSTIHLDDGFTIVAISGDEPIAVISVCWKTLPDPMPQTREAFVDLIDVDPEFRRQGIARRLIELAAVRAVDAGAYQLRAWTCSDRPAALTLWRGLGFCLCPAVVLVGSDDRPIQGYFVARRLG